MPSRDEIFSCAREIADPAQRDAYLHCACDHDAELHKQVKKMLEDAAKADDFFNADKVGRGVPQAVKEGLGTIIGRYKLLEKIGEGGMGVVFMAEQREPVRRKVALKIIKAGMDTRQVVARFEAERQALALMDHPNIAKVLDGGETETGRPYFVMDLVQGLPITHFCDEAKLSTRERLELFLEVCSAIQHAHQKGIIHRDIKPSNILVTLHGDKPVPKVIDFGIAKATQQPLTDKTLFTQFQHFIGTPAYTSPEQASLSGLDIDTRSDIYALGVLLYELLTGTTPFDGKELLKSGIDEMRRIIREADPPRPSTRVAATAVPACRKAKDSLEPIEQDLDWIVMKCLEKERSRRYETANGLAADIRRHLSDEPVAARPPSVAYRWRKSISRHKVVFAAAATIIGTLVVGFTVSTWLFFKERDARGRAVAAEKVESQLRREAESARRKAEAGQTALLYWQAFDALSSWSEEEQRRLRTLNPSVEAAALVARYDDVFHTLHRAASIKAGCDWAVNLDDGSRTWVPKNLHVRHAADAARLRAGVALSKGRTEAAYQDLLSTFVLGRHIAVDGSLVSVMIQVEVESGIVGFVAQNFGRFPPNVMAEFAKALRNAPARVDVVRGARMEQRGGAQWLIREIEKARTEAAGDEGKTIQHAREILAEGVGPGGWAEEVMVAAGGTSRGLIAYISEAAPYYDMLSGLAVAPPDKLQAETAKIARAIESSTNLVVQRILPNLERARRREIEVLVRLAMLDAAVAFMSRGKAGLQSVSDPFGHGPFAHHPVQDGFELRSEISGHGYNGSLKFVTSGANK